MGQILKAESDPAGVELGRLLGRREAFATVAGRCSAAEAESLHRIRQEKTYRELGLTWDEFCEKRLGACRRSIDRMLRLFDEFGPQYFHVAQITHVTPDEYRAIAPNISAEGVQVDGDVIALLPENSEQVSAAVAGLLQREKPVKAPPTLSVETMAKRCHAMVEALDRMSELQQMDATRLAIAIAKLRCAAAKKGAQTL
jgi:hypothetical protein